MGRRPARKRTDTLFQHKPYGKTQARLLAPSPCSRAVPEQPRDEVATGDRRRRDGHYHARRSGGSLNEVDKNRFGREVPLSEAARGALDQVCPDVGLLFGSHDYRRLLRQAAKEAGIDEYRAARISDYDLRHSRLTHLGQVSSNLSGVMFLAGHKQPATTARYLRPQKQAAAEVLDAAAAAEEFRSHSGRKGRSRHSQAKAAAPRNTNGSKAVRGRGLEPRWMLSTSTSS